MVHGKILIGGAIVLLASQAWGDISVAKLNVLENYFGGGRRLILTPVEAKTLGGALDCDLPDLLKHLGVFAARWAVGPEKKLASGTAAQGSRGDIYLGVNFELPGKFGGIVSAEQFVTILARVRGDSQLTFFKPPVGGEKIIGEILSFPGAPHFRLSPAHETVTDVLANQAIQGARRSYTAGPRLAGVAFQSDEENLRAYGGRIAGPSGEFSFSPLMTAAVDFYARGGTFGDIYEGVWVEQAENSREISAELEAVRAPNLDRFMRESLGIRNRCVARVATGVF